VRSAATPLPCTDPALAQHSATRLLDLDFTVAVMSHGPVLRERAKEQLRAAIERQ
jgi:hypothetical protein